MFNPCFATAYCQGTPVHSSRSALDTRTPLRCSERCWGQKKTGLLLLTEFELVDISQRSSVMPGLGGGVRNVSAL